MSKNPIDIILKILEIIDYKGDRQKFANQFIENCQKQALLDLISALPENKQIALRQQLLHSDASSNIQQVLKQYFPEEKYLEAISRATENAFSDFLQAIKDGLSGDQSSNLQVFLSSLVKQKSGLVSPL